MNSTNINPVYDNNGAIIYTIVTLLFYSLSLFCLLILNIDPDDQYYEQKSSIYPNKKRKIFKTSQVDILNTLSDQSLRQKYWRIYYDNDEYELSSDKFLSAELKRLSSVSQRMKELNNEQLKQTNKHEELYELNRMGINQTSQTAPVSSSSPYFFRFRRTRSTSVPYADLSSQCLLNRSFSILAETPLCKPEYS